VPDIAGWLRDRMPAVPCDAYVTLALCEVISPSTGALDRSRRMAVYACEGVGHLWIVDPIPRTLEIYRLEDGRWVVAAQHGGDVEVHAEPFDAVAVDLRRCWGEA